MRLAFPMDATPTTEGVSFKLPVYVYHCEQCGCEIEKRQSFSDAPLTECERCHGSLRKVLSPAVVIFKGSGFYSTDNGSKSAANGKNGSSEKNGSDDKSEPKPVAESKEPAKASTAKED